MLTLEDRKNVELNLIIFSEKNTILSFQGIKAGKSQGRNRRLRKHIPTHHIIDLLELFYLDARLVSEEIGITIINTNKNIKPEREIRLKEQIK